MSYIKSENIEQSKANSIIEKEIANLKAEIANLSASIGTSADAVTLLNTTAFTRYDSGEFSVSAMGGVGTTVTKAHGLSVVPSLVTVWGQFDGGATYWIQLVCQPLIEYPEEDHGGNSADRPQGVLTIKADTTNISLRNHCTADGQVMVGNKGMVNINKIRIHAIAFN